MKCKYIGKEQEYDVSFALISEHVVRLTGDAQAYDTGFVLSREGRNDDWNYSQFRTVFSIGEGYVEYSDDGSVYEEPEQTEDVPESGDPSDYEERIAALEEELKAAKILLGLEV